MKAINVDDVLKILHKYGVTDEKQYFSMVDEIANLEEVESDFAELYRKRCKDLEERLSKQTMDCYAKIDRQAVEIALLKSIIEEKGGFHKFHEHIREDSQE